MKRSRHRNTAECLSNSSNVQVMTLYANNYYKNRLQNPEAYNQYSVLIVTMENSKSKQIKYASRQNEI